MPTWYCESFWILTSQLQNVEYSRMGQIPKLFLLKDPFVCKNLAFSYIFHSWAFECFRTQRDQSKSESSASRSIWHTFASNTGMVPYGTLSVREYVKTRLAGITPTSITHGQSLANTWVCFPSPQDAESKWSEMNQIFSHSCRSRMFSVALAVQHCITGNLGPHDGSLLGDVHGLFGQDILRMWLNGWTWSLYHHIISYHIISYRIVSYHIISYHICFLECPPHCN